MKRFMQSKARPDQIACINGPLTGVHAKTIRQYYRPIDELPDDFEEWKLSYSASLIDFGYELYERAC